MIVPTDYPFDRSLIRLPERTGTTVRDTLFLVSPEGEPLDLPSALNMSGPGCEIVLTDGIYKGGPYYIPESLSGDPAKPIILRAEHPGKAIIDGSSFVLKLPVMILRGHHWIIEGIVFSNSPSCGLFVCGSFNVIKGCETSYNGDTGLLICSFPGASRKEWPSGNKIDRCVSHDNCDISRLEADGFGAKLPVGKGNSFYSCRAFHNIDGGFDLYTTSSSISPVYLENCEAAFNGWLSEEDRPLGEARTGIGFKLGGENQRVSHSLRGCAAHHNAKAGFDTNSNPSATLNVCEAWDNVNDFMPPEKKASISVWYKAEISKCNEFLESKLLPHLMYYYTLIVNRSSIEKFAALIPEIKSYYYPQVNTQLCRRAIQSGFWSLDKFYRFVVSDQERLSKLRHSLTFLGSSFFRGEIWPRLVEVCRDSFQNTSKEKIRIWCAGCSEGKEVYSILMVLLDFVPAEKIEIFATDYNCDRIEKSRKGIYPLRTIRMIPKEYRHYVNAYLPDKNAESESLKLVIPARLKEMVQFKIHNLLSDEYPGGFDLILCRNVIKFFEKDVKSQVQGKLAASLNDGGYLVISDDLVREGIHDPGAFGLIQLENTCIYRKNQFL